jgi:hypothetical protein
MPSRLAVLCLLVLLSACNVPVDPGRIAGVRSIGVISTCAGDTLHIGHTGFLVLGDSYLEGDIHDWNVDARLAATAKAILGRRFRVVDATVAPGESLPFFRGIGFDLKPGTLRTPQPVDAYLVISTLWTSTSASHDPARSYIGAGLRVFSDAAFGYASCQAHLVEAHTRQVLGTTNQIGRTRAGAGREHESWEQFTPPEREAAREAVLQAAELVVIELLGNMRVADTTPDDAVALGADEFAVLKRRGLVGGGAAGAREAAETAARSACAARRQVPRELASLSPELMAYYVKVRCVAPGAG